MEHTRLVFFLASLLFISFSKYSSALDVLRRNQTIRDNGDTIVSANNEFELGFFSPGSSTQRYVGIWFKKISKQTIVWVANRDAPLNNTSGILRIDNKAISLSANASSTTIWSSNPSRFLNNPVAQLLDSGNLVFRDEDGGSENIVWQSFDYIGDTLLPGMKIGTDFVTGLQRYYSSWKSVDDPSTGRFVHRIDTHGYPQLTLWIGSKLQARTGPWIGNQFSGDPVQKNNRIYYNEFFIGQKEVYYAFDLFTQSSSTPATMLKLTSGGTLQRLIWIDQDQAWTNFLTLFVSDCDQYGLCGPYGVCDGSSSPRCTCLRGFHPKTPEKWGAADWKDGCVRIKSLDCRQGEGFLKYSGVKLPDTRQSWYSLSMDGKECKSMCLKNCTCTAYSTISSETGGNRCLLWFDELMDMEGYTDDGQDIYLKMPASELDKGKLSKVKRTLIISIPVVLTVISVLIILYLLRKRKLNIAGRLNSHEEQNLEIPSFEFRKLARATSNFSDDKKIGEGGFGPVYKGLLEDGQLIAVKRLSDNSRQGIDEFKNEVSLIAKLQHRNLVALLGYCIEEGERILIYEYMPNGSLDSFIFSTDVSSLAKWPTLRNIIIGVARGLLYLHQDSKLRIIHRDLKASNVLLDTEMNPKISDFGMARSFGGNQTEANTTRVVGTFGYMPPEYVIDGIFSMKSDVYSFGVLVLETVSGKKNRFFEHPDHNLNLVGHAWRSFNEDKLEELIDRVILESNNQYEVFRVIQIGLLCVQEFPIDRPNMSSVVLMLNSRIALPKPKKPGFFTATNQHGNTDSERNSTLYSSNDYSLTMVAPR